MISRKQMWSGTARSEQRKEEMKKRWMNSVIKSSKTEATALPFHRSVRLARKKAQPITLARELKTA